MGLLHTISDGYIFLISALHISFKLATLVEIQANLGNCSKQSYCHHNSKLGSKLLPASCRHSHRPWYLLNLLFESITRIRSCIALWSRIHVLLANFSLPAVQVTKTPPCNLPLLSISASGGQEANKRDMITD